MTVFNKGGYTGGGYAADSVGIFIDKIEVDGNSYCVIYGKYYQCETVQFEEIE